MTKELWEGNEAIAEAAVRAGVEAYFGYPITPQTELLEYMARRMPELGRVFLQAESELGAINMVYGASCAGARTMTSSSSPGMSLMQEGLSYIAASEVPCVVVNMARGGPGLGNIYPAQGDYFQATKGGGHGDYHPIVLAPASVQEAVDLTVLAFDLAEKYRWIAIVLGDGAIGQMMEPAEMPPIRPVNKERPDWALAGIGHHPDGKKRIVSSLYLQAEELEVLNLRLQAQQTQIQSYEVRYKEYLAEGAQVLVVGYGTAGRIAQTAVKEARKERIPAGLLRPITLWPFPYEKIKELARGAEAVLAVEMSAGQMVEDVRLAVEGRAPVYFLGKMGGLVPLVDDILAEIRKLAGRKEGK